MNIRVGINGFGRNLLRAVRVLNASGVGNIEIVGIKGLTHNAMLAHLLKYDSILGRLDADVSVEDRSIRVGDRTIAAFAERVPANLPCSDLGGNAAIEKAAEVPEVFHLSNRLLRH